MGRATDRLRPQPGARGSAILNEAIEHSTALYDYRPRTMAMMEGWFDAKEKGEYPVIGAVDDTAACSASRRTARSETGQPANTPSSTRCRGRGLPDGGIREAAAGGVIARARVQQYHNVIGGIDATNDVSIALHTRFGFQFCGRVRHAGFKFSAGSISTSTSSFSIPAQPVDG